MDVEVVISGTSGRFPESDNIAEFCEHLYNKVDLVTEDNRRWEPGLYGIPRRMGKLKDVSKFDSQFFGVHPKQAHQLDPQGRILLELTYESIVDAGYDPVELRGKSVGVYIGSSNSESEAFFFSDPKVKGYALTGCISCMLANRISYTFDFTGPSFTLDTACSSGAVAMYEAVNAIRRGECEAAIVGGANLCLRPQSSVAFHKLQLLSEDGACKSFDASGNGYAKSEAIGVLFLQRADAARRIYASVVNIKSNTDGYKEQGVTVPSASMQKCLMTDVYKECKLDPLNVSYVEAHGTGTALGDPIEMSAIAETFCSGRSEPLLIGTVKSNMGHSEATSGICSVIKVILTMEKKLIPPNLHFKNPNPEIKPLMDGQVKVVTEATPWEGEYAAFSSFGFGGVNVHGVLKSNAAPSEGIEDTHKDIPRLVLYSGRTEESVQTVFDYLSANGIPREFFALLHKSVYTSTQIKPFRGYKIIGSGEDVAAIQKTSFHRRPVWYVFTGMGCQWLGMGKQLMQIEAFAMSIRKSAEVLRPHGLDLIDLITCEKKSAANVPNVTSAFVSIIAVQVALVDILTELGLKPDGIVGHSIGEIACAYADGSLTSDQTVLAAYYRAKALVDSYLPEGAMAAVGLTWSEAKSRCPKDIYPSCHNAEDSVTISGPKESLQMFEEALKAENVFVRKVDSCGYAFHSHYIFPAAEKLRVSLEKVIPNPKPRTTRWITTSYPEEEWGDLKSSIADASYFVHNMVSPVLFYEALSRVPKDAVIVEVAPHHLLQNILKRVIGPDAEYIGLMRKNADNTVHILSSIGKLYTAGLNPDIEKLYPPVKFPVTRGTPMISPLIKWDHSDTWTVPKWDKNTGRSQTTFEVNAGPEDSPDHYLLDHFIDGRHVFPATGYILLAWRAFAEIKGKDINEFPVLFENLKFHRATFLSLTVSTKFTVGILTENGGAFEIIESGITVCTGQIYVPEEVGKNCVVKKLQLDRKTLTLNKNDIYKDFRLKGLSYGPNFQEIISGNITGTECIVKWTGNWVTFLDSILQLYLMLPRDLYLPVGIQALTIDPFMQKKLAEEYARDYEGIPLQCDKLSKSYFAGGVHCKNLKFSLVPRQPNKQIPLLEQYKFVPYTEANVLSKEDAKMYKQYIDVCSSISKRILKLYDMKDGQFLEDIKHKFKEIDETIIKTYLKSNSEKYVLLRCLSDMMNSIATEGSLKNMETYINRYLTEREKDLLSETLLKEISLRTVVDTILENVTLSKLKVAEFIEGSSPLSPKISKCILTPGKINISYSFAHTNGHLLNKDDLPPNSEVTSLKNKLSFDFKDVDIFVLNYLLSSESKFESILENATSCISNKGFIILLQRTQHVLPEKFLRTLSKTVIPVISENDLEHLFKKLNLVVVSKKSDSISSCLYLLRKYPTSCFKDSIIHIPFGKYNTWVEGLREKMAQSQDSDRERIWLVSEGSYNSGIIGLVNCLRLEPGGSHIRCVFNGEEDVEIPKFSLTSSFYKDLLERNLVMNVFQNGTWGSYRHIQCSEDTLKTVTEHAYVNVLTPGDLSSLAWIDSSLKFYTPTEDTVLCQVYYSSLNFRDVMLASGKLPVTSIPGDLALQDSMLGIEFSGRTMTGDRVMGFTFNKALATTVAGDSSFLLSVPEKWTLEEAATVPVAYSTAYYALCARGRLKKGDKVLIHSGSGGVGQAAIAIALSLGCEIFTTVGSAEKREFLKKRFPQLMDRNFCNSRDTSFEEHVLKATNGEGVDVVLNSLAEEKLFASLNCLAKHGRFLEIGKYDLSKDSALGMALFLKNVAFHGILLDSLFDKDRVTRQIKQEVVDLVTQGIEDGTVRPLNTSVFNYNEVEKAFRYMASGKHTGKVILKIKDEETQKKVIPSPVRITAIKRTTFNPQKSYIIIGGLGGFGMELCQWMIKRGARNIFLTSRSGITTGYQQLCISRWKQRSVNVVVTKLNAVKLNEAKMLLEIASEHGAVGGIFNLALVLRDAFMENQTVQNYEEVCESKVQSTENMDLLSRKRCPDLEWFVCFSSESCGRGNAGQSNYGYANSVMERICERRQREGLPGLAIQWGAIGDVGVLQDKDVFLGLSIPQGITSCLLVLDKFLQQSHPVVSSLVPYQPFSETSGKSSECSILPTVANIFGIKDITSINPETSMGKLGMDSLIGVELKQVLERDFDLVLSFSELRKLKIKDLKKMEGDGTKQKEKNSSGDGIKETFPGHYLSMKVLVPAETIIHMNTVTVGCPLFIVHPIEGSVEMLQSVAESLTCPVYGVQCTTEAPTHSMEHLASWYWKHLKSVGIATKSIHLSGYSFGAKIACEMTFQAENNPDQHPKVKSLVLLEGSPLFAPTYLNYDQPSEKFTETDGEIRRLILIASIFSQNVSLRKTDLLNLRDFNERLKYTAEKVVSIHPKFRIEDVKIALNLLNAKAIMHMKYEPKFKLRSDVTLIKASESLLSTQYLSDAYDLEKVCEGKITVHRVKGNHATFIQGNEAKNVSKIMRKITENH